MSGVVAALVTSGSGFKASALPGALSGYKVGTGTVYTSLPSAVTVQGGQPPYTYEWVRVSGSILVSPQSASNFSTRFYSNITAVGAERTAVYKCTVTDANAFTVDTNTVSIYLTSV